MRSFCLLVIALLFTGGVRAQDFNYTVSTDTVSWQELNSQTILNANNSAWNFAYKIGIGFTYNYLGHNFDSLRIESNGYLIFDEARNYAFTYLNGMGDHPAAGIHSVLGYEQSGTAGNRILKIQYKNIGPGYGSQRLSFQIWLRENGDLEVHMGPNGYRPQLVEIDTTWVVRPAVSEIDTTRNEDNVITSIDTLWGSELVPESIDSIYTEMDSVTNWRFGLINTNVDTPVSGFFLSGFSDAPVGQLLYPFYDSAYMLVPPRPSIRYTFTPSSN